MGFCFTTNKKGLQKSAENLRAEQNSGEASTRGETSFPEVRTQQTVSLITPRLISVEAVTRTRTTFS